jgi:hypothetical protein
MRNELIAFFKDESQLVLVAFDSESVFPTNSFSRLCALSRSVNDICSLLLTIVPVTILSRHALKLIVRRWLNRRVSVCTSVWFAGRWVDRLTCRAVHCNRAGRLVGTRTHHANCVRIGMFTSPNGRLIHHPVTVVCGSNVLHCYDGHSFPAVDPLLGLERAFRLLLMVLMVA